MLTKSSGMASKNWFASVSRTLTKNNYSFKDFVKNPFYLMSIDPKYERYLVNKYSHDETFQWYNVDNCQISKFAQTFPNHQYVESFLERYPQYKDHAMDSEEDEGNKYFLFVIDYSSPVRLDQPGPSHENTQRQPKKTGAASQPSDEKREGVKRRIDEPSQSGSSVSKKSAKNIGRSKNGPSTVKPTAKFGNARGISERTKSSRVATHQTDPEKQGEVDQEQQIQTIAGNDHNERGSIVGESGNRKIQKKQGPVFGTIEVSCNINMSNALVLAFTNKEPAEQVAKVIDALYGHTRYEIKVKRHSLKDKVGVDHEFYWVLVKFGFNMSVSSMVEKFGVNFKRAKYCLLRPLKRVDDEDDDTESPDVVRLFQTLQILYENEAGLTTIDSLLAAEQRRRDYNASQTSKKRKLTYD